MVVLIIDNRIFEQLAIGIPLVEVDHRDWEGFPFVQNYRFKSVQEVRVSDRRNIPVLSPVAVRVWNCAYKSACGCAVVDRKVTGVVELLAGDADDDFTVCDVISA